MRVISCPNCSELLSDDARYCPRCGETWGPTISEASLTQPLVIVHTNWHKDVAAGSHRAFSASGTATMPADATSTFGSPSSPSSHPSHPPRLPLSRPPRFRHRWYSGGFLRPSLFFMLSMLVLGALVVGGLFGVVVTLGRDIFVQTPPGHGVLTLQITPSNVALGSTITLRGSNFSPSANVGLTRDENIPIFDRYGKNIIVASAAGSFTVSVTISSAWRAGTHIIRAEDAMLHKIAAFTVQVTGFSPSLRPAHLLLAASSLELGPGDQTMNSTQTITLSNTGGGQISWQANATQPWLLYSPANGTINAGQSVQVRIAADRANLKVGFYSSQVFFSSNAGQATLTVKMQVEPLETGHEAVLQLTPSVLSFTANDGGTNPPAQVVTVSNPGVRPLQWSVSAYAGNNWLSVSPQADTTLRGQSEAVVISVNTASLLPGNYSGVVTFTSQGAEAVQDSPQNIYINLTILPQCTLQVSPGALSFSGVYSQSAPPAETVNLTVSQGCTTSLSWNASSTASWLHMSTTSGQTPSALTLGITTTSLNPGTYTSIVLFNSQAGTQSLPVTYSVGKLALPIMGTTPSSMSLSSIIGQPAPAAQPLIITNSGSGTLTWNAAASTTVGGSWLSVATTSGTLPAQQSIAVGVEVNPPANLPPGTYNGAITVTGMDSSGHPLNGSPQVLSVTFVVNAPCTISVSSTALAFVSASDQASPAMQLVTISAGGDCSHTLNWTAAISAGGTWLTAKPAMGSVSLKDSSKTHAAVSLTGLASGTYNATMTISATDSVTGASIGSPVVIAVTLTVQPPCTLQVASGAGGTFTVEEGANLPAQSFTVSVTGVCSNTLTLTPTVTLGSGIAWLSISPGVTPMTGNSQTFTATITSAALAAGSYSGSISLSAVGGGVAVLGSPQTIAFNLNVIALPALAVSSASLHFTVTAGEGIVSKAITLSNTGGAPLNWTATPAADAPTFLSLSATSGSNLTGGANTAFNVSIDTTGLQEGIYKTSITIQAIDPLTGNVVQGSPMKIPVTIKVKDDS